jgi:hypothetical protein
MKLRLLTLLLCLSAWLSLIPSASAYYNTDVGRFMSQDPIAEDGGVNLVGFVGNDPINNVDFLGNCPCRVNSFKGSAVTWLAETNGIWSNSVRITLRVKFRAVVEDKEACIINQMMKGDSPGFNTSANWVIDHEQGKDWWDGESWHSGVGRAGNDAPKSITGWLPSGLSGGKDEAVFFDDPGFRNVPTSSFPTWMAAYGGSGTGFYKFKTQVLNREDRKVVRSIEWGVRIYCPKGAKGHSGCIYSFIGF